MNINESMQIRRRTYFYKYSLHELTFPCFLIKIWFVVGIKFSYPLNIQYSIFSVQCSVFGIWYLVFGIWYLVFMLSVECFLHWSSFPQHAQPGLCRSVIQPALFIIIISGICDEFAWTEFSKWEWIITTQCHSINSK